MLSHSSKFYKKLKCGEEGNNTITNVTSTRNLSTSSPCSNDGEIPGTSRPRNFSDGVNALLNNLILQHLFDLCPFHILNISRLVCKQWYVESLLSWQTYVPLILTLSKDNDLVVILVNKHTKEEVQIPIEKFLKCITPNNVFLVGKKPYRYIRIKDSLISPATKNQFDHFWKEFGSSLTILEFNGCSFPDDEEFRKTIFTRCPNLRRLIIEACTFSSTLATSSSSYQEEKEQEGGPPLEYKKPTYGPNRNVKLLKILWETWSDAKLPVPWLELFTNFPSLSSIEIRRVTTRLFETPELDSLMEAIRIIRKNDVNALPLQNFAVGSIVLSGDDPLTRKQLATFKELRLPLQEVMIRPDPFQGQLYLEFNVVNGILTNHAKTLSDIKIMHWIPPRPLPQFPFGHRLDNLSSLLITGTLCKNFTFLKYLPNLKSLHVIGGGRSGRLTQAIRNTRGDQQMLKLKVLTLTCCSLEDGDIAKIRLWTPNVIELTVTLTDKQFGMVCEKWKNLKVLKVKGEDLTDWGVTGMKETNPKPIAIYPNITDLHDLKEFGFGSNKLTVKSVYHGLLKLPNIRIVEAFARVLPVRWGKHAIDALLERNVECKGLT